MDQELDDALATISAYLYTFERILSEAGSWWRS